mmetsp:Transcript_55833/g.121591  ORF Transcript_55833/g.121591 Transcript_55833/m.121591 type:complete len:81 (-) Transcript_55833:85-327(-)|eukprot:5326001-Pleurochrysis_carterae.AAC.1
MSNENTATDEASLWRWIDRCSDPVLGWVATVFERCFFKLLQSNKKSNMFRQRICLLAVLLEPCRVHTDIGAGADLFAQDD